MADPSPIRLLLIEDSDIDAMFVSRLLKSNPKVAFEIEHATTLADALNLLRVSLGCQKIVLGGPQFLPQPVEPGVLTCLI